MADARQLEVFWIEPKTGWDFLVASAALESARNLQLRQAALRSVRFFGSNLNIALLSRLPRPNMHVGQDVDGKRHVHTGLRQIRRRVVDLRFVVL